MRYKVAPCFELRNRLNRSMQNFPPMASIADDDSLWIDVMIDVEVEPKMISFYGVIRAKFCALSELKDDSPLSYL